MFQLKIFNKAFFKTWNIYIYANCQYSFTYCLQISWYDMKLELALRILFDKWSWSMVFITWSHDLLKYSLLKYSLVCKLYTCIIARYWAAQYLLLTFVFCVICLASYLAQPTFFQNFWNLWSEIETLFYLHHCQYYTTLSKLSTLGN